MGDEPPCPDGTIARGDAPPKGHLLWCETPSGTAQGWRVAWYYSGGVFTRFTYDAGLSHGVHRWWFDNGQQMDEQSFDHGRGCGVRTTWGRDGVPKSQTEYDPCPEF